MSAMRSLARTVAHSRMKQAGYTAVNRKIGGSSFFSNHWRDFVKSNNPRLINGKRVMESSKNMKDKRR